MVKFKECCCGCTLRNGTLIILWTTLALESIRVLFYVGKLTYDSPYVYYYEEHFSTELCDFFFLCACLTGAGFSIVGIYGIQKNRADVLNLCYYYYMVYFGYWIFLAIVVVFIPSLHYYVSVFSIYHMFGRRLDGREEFVFAVAYLFTSALCWYIYMIIKSCKENMMKNQDRNFDPEMPDPTTLGYNPSL